MSKCYICGVDVENLLPFGGPGDPLTGDFTGQKLVKTYRALYEGPAIEKYEEILNKYTYNSGSISDNLPELEKEYGVEEVDRAFAYDQAKNTVGSSWECRDCILK